MLQFDLSQFEVSKGINDEIPLTWWAHTPNFGDLLAPYLVEKLTSQKVKLVNNKPGRRRKIGSVFKKQHFSYLTIGSIISRANSNSIVWGSGAFGTEKKTNLNEDASYLAVRGPLTRNLLRIHGIQCPEVYGDPALLIPTVYPAVEPKKYKIGVIMRWSETDWHPVQSSSDVKIINLGTSDVEGTLKEIVACEKIISSSLHGIILADAYGIPSAWLSSTTPKGLEYKFYDYFLSVNKIQKPQQFDFNVKYIDRADFEKKLEFNDQLINIDLNPLLNACPFLRKI